MEILYKTEIISTNLILFFVFLGALVVSIVLLSVSRYDNWHWIVEIFLWLAFTASAVLTITTAAGATFGVHSGRYRYECTLDDNIQFSDIGSKYDVVEQRGYIWVLEDK